MHLCLMWLHNNNNNIVADVAAFVADVAAAVALVVAVLA